MRYLLIFLLAISTNSYAENPENLYEEDVSSIENICAALNSTISGKSSEQTDWYRLVNLFLSSANITNASIEGESDSKTLDISSYISKKETWYQEAGVEIRVIKNTIREFGSIAAVFQSWEMTNESSTTKGIQCIQLVYDQDRWWIASLTIDQEDGQKTIDRKYLEEIAEEPESTESELEETE